ncbi:bacillithiol system redox-active protein YtxJ [Salipaludibacillus sp. CF4.18]|uniref:bacillithiol system redox-active protein YtxJ n=1 Tax=Salipaludibacillus sp. CF4.18 TaxID=3373081 RepID=UPI003EE77F48
MEMKKLESNEELSQLYDTTDIFFLMKNSTTCPISSEAYSEMESYTKEEGALPVYYLNVQELRDVSNQVAEHFQIKHESPQAFLIQKGKVAWHSSHWHIKKDALNKAVSDNK